MKLIDNRKGVISNAFNFIDNLNHEVYILGTNKYGLCTAKWLKKLGHNIGGFINDYFPDSKFGSYDVFNSDKIPINSSIINCIVEGRVTIAEGNIIKLKPISHINYFALQVAFPGQLMGIDFLEETNQIADNIEEYRIIYDHLTDLESKITFENISNFRLNRDIQYLKNFAFRLKEQYFEPFIQINKYPTFIDGGGFDGETSLTFASLYPQYKVIYYFEPNKSALLNSKEKLKSLPNILFFQKGLWRQSDTLHFDNSLGSASKFSTNGNIEIETVALDEIISSKIDFIKLDIEGAEFDALIGAKRLIQTYRPALAICVYHNQKDFIQIPELLLSYKSDYKIYLRHYSQGVFETVMYFV
jgi:FkbM family methyltransferase